MTEPIKKKEARQARHSGRDRAPGAWPHFNSSPNVVAVPKRPDRANSRLGLWSYSEPVVSQQQEFTGGFRKKMPRIGFRTTGTAGKCGCGRRLWVLRGAVSCPDWTKLDPEHTHGEPVL